MFHEGEVLITRERMNDSIHYTIHIPHRYRDGNHTLIVRLYNNPLDTPREVRYTIKAETPRVELWTEAVKIEEEYE